MNDAEFLFEIIECAQAMAMEGEPREKVALHVRLALTSAQHESVLYTERHKFAERIMGIIVWQHLHS